MSPSFVTRILQMLLLEKKGKRKGDVILENEDNI